MISTLCWSVKAPLRYLMEHNYNPNPSYIDPMGPHYLLGYNLRVISPPNI